MKKILVILFIGIGVFLFLMYWLNRYVYRPKASSDTMSVILTPSSKTDLKTNEEFIVTVSLSYPDVNRKISAADLVFKFDQANSDILDYIPSVSQNYFDEVIVDELTKSDDGAKIIRVSLISQKNNDQLFNLTSLNLKFKAKNKGLTSLILDKARSQIVGPSASGTEGDNVFPLPAQEITASFSVND